MNLQTCSDKGPLLGNFFLIFRLPGLFLNYTAFSQTLLVIAHTYRYIEMLLFSTSFVISGLFGDVKTEKIGSFGVSGRSNLIIAIFSEQKILLRYLPK